MSLTKLADDRLLNAIKALVAEERGLLARVLHHLREIQRRRLFSTLKYASLFDYAVQELKYSESQAQRRITAMHMLDVHPEIEAPIKSGALSLTNVNLARTLFKQLRMSKEDQAKVLKSFENKTTREAKAMAGEICPAMKSAKRFDFDCIDDELLKAKLLTFKYQLSHVKPSMNLTELLHCICDRLDQLENKSAPNQKSDSKSDSAAPKSVLAIRRHVWKKGKGQCSNCGSKHRVQTDHAYPRAMGGADSAENMRLLCQNCNLRRAIEFYGIDKMDPFINGARNRVTEDP